MDQEVLKGKKKAECKFNANNNNDDDDDDDNNNSKDPKKGSGKLNKRE